MLRVDFIGMAVREAHDLKTSMQQLAQKRFTSLSYAVLVENAVHDTVYLLSCNDFSRVLLGGGGDPESSLPRVLLPGAPLRVVPHYFTSRYFC